MPFLPLSELEKQKLQNANQGTQTVAGPSGVITSGQGSSGGKGPSRVGSYTNLQSYLSANKEQAADMANKVAQGIADQGNQAKSAVDTLQSSFQTKVDQNAIRPNQQLVNEAANDTVNFVKDQNKVDQFTKMRDAQYAGPSNIVDDEGYSDVQKKVQDTQSKLKATESEPGRFTLLQEQFKSPTYTKGMQRLDQLLLQNDPTAKDKFAEVRSQYSNLNDYLGQASTNASNYVEQAKADTASAKQAAQSTVNSAYSQSAADLAKKVDDYNAARNKINYNDVRADLHDVDLIDYDLLTSLGLRNNSNTYGLNLDDYLTDYGAGDINKVSSKDDYNRLKALEMLLGKDTSVFSDNPQLESQINPMGFDMNRYQSDLAQKEQAYKNTYSSAPNINSIFPGISGWNPTYGQSPIQQGASWKDIEEKWIPYYTEGHKRHYAATNGQMTKYGEIANALQNALNNMKAQYGADKIINNRSLK